MPLPEGLLIGSQSKQWRVGKVLGAGACGSVHEITSETKSRSPKTGMEYVVKIAPIPDSSGATAKRRRKKKTPLERNADLLNYESNLYRNVLNDLRGAKVPEVPHSGDGGPPGYGDTDGYRYLCMEKMEAPLTAIVPALIEEQRRKRSRSKTVALGEVACTLLGLVEAIHSHRLVFVDVKPENFMLCRSTSTRAPTCADLCKRLRMIDFGLVENFRDVSLGGHRDDMFPDGQMVGTPIYASLNVLEGHTASRRDDLEALGYVILELVLILVSYGQTESSHGRKGGSKGKESTSSALPWSGSKSDDEILQAKKKAIEGSAAKSFFAKIGADGNKVAGGTLKQYFSAVRRLEYAEKPNYEDLKSILRKLIIEVDVGETELKPAATSSGRRTAGVKRASRRTRSRSSENNEFDEDQPPTAKKRKGERKRATEERVEMTQPIDAIEVDSETDDFHSCCSEAEDMEWEAVPDENTLPKEVLSDENQSPARSDDLPIPSKASEEKRAGRGKGIIEVIFISGPHQGESFALGGDSSDVVTVGRSPTKPRSKTGRNAVYKISGDDHTSPSHVKLTLYTAKGGAFSVRVTDLKTDNGTEVNGKAVEKGKYKQAFIGAKIRIGESVMKLKKGN